MYIRAHMYVCMHVCVCVCVCVCFFAHKYLPRDSRAFIFDENTILQDWRPTLRVKGGLQSIWSVTWIIHMCEITHSFVWHDSFTWAKRLIHSFAHKRGAAVYVMCDIHCSYVSNVAGLLNMCDISLSYVWHDLFICVTWLFYTCDMTPSEVWHDSIKCVTWRIHSCGVKGGLQRIYRVTWLLNRWQVSFKCVTWLLRMYDVTHPFLCA